MSQAEWAPHLIKALKSGGLDQVGRNNVDEILVWFRSIDSAHDSIFEQCAIEAGSPKAAKHNILKLIDACLLKAPVNMRNVFGTRVIKENDQKAIRLRYKRLSSVFHPDRELADKDWLNSRMTLINNAYSHALKLEDTSTRHDGDYTVEADVVAATPSTVMGTNVYSREEQQHDLVWSTLEIQLLKQLQKLTTTKAKGVALLGVIVFFVAAVLMTTQTEREQLIAISSEARVTSVLPAPALKDEQISHLVDELLENTSTRGKVRNPSQNNVESQLNPFVESMMDDYNMQLPQALEPLLKDVPDSPEADLVDEPELVTNLPSVNKTIPPRPVAEINVEFIPPPASTAELTNRTDTDESAGLAPMIRQATAMSQPNNTGTQSALVAVPQPIQTMLKSLQDSFANSAAQDFGDHFVRDASYFNEKGRAAIVRARTNLFEVVQSPEMVFDIVSYSDIGQNGHTLQGYLKQQYVLHDQRELTFCDSVNITVGMSDQRLRIYSVKRLDQFAANC